MNLWQDLDWRFGIQLKQYRVLDGGWLNQKWVVNEKWVVKQYSKQRYEPSKFESIENALNIQSQLYQQGVCCPQILRDTQGQVLFETDCGERYMVMSYLPGKVLHQVNVKQMMHLGQVCYHMHREIQKISPPTNIKYLTKDRLVSEWEKRAHHTPLAADQLEILHGLSDTYLHNLTMGYAHEDLSNDNCLFVGDQVSGIIDFDRCAYTYPLHDVGRVLLSFAYDGHKLSLPLVRAFMQGYSGLEKNDVITGLRLVWLMEAGWWLNQQKSQVASKKIQRFIEELCFLTRHFNDLENILCI